MDNPSTLAALAASPLLIGLLAWSLRRNVKSADDKVAAAEGAAAAAQRAAGEIVAAVRKEITESGEATRRAIEAVSGKVDTLSSSVVGHGERLARGDERISALAFRVDGLEARERDRGCFTRCALGSSKSG